MPECRTIEIEPAAAPTGAAEEFAAAVEAATGEPCAPPSPDPLIGVAIKEAFERVLLSQRPDRGLDVLVRSGVMEAVLPEVFAMVGFGEGVRHKDVWAHTKKVILRSPRTPILRWAALLHDIGKVPTRKFEPDGQVSFLGHPLVGGRMFSKISHRLCFQKEEYKRIRFLIVEHLRASAFDDTWTDSAVRRFARDIGDDLDDLLQLSRADITSKYAEKVRRGIELIDILAERIRELKEIDAKPAPLPKGLGTVLIEHFHIAPGPKLGSIISKLKDDVETGRLGIQESFDHYIRYIENHPEILSTT
jgi:poly(A) polymerase